MSDEDAFEVTPYASNPHLENWKLFIVITDFSKSIKQEHGVKTNFIIDEELEMFMERFEILLYANGCSLQNQGYISLLFLENISSHLSSDFVTYKFVCLASIIDNDGKSKISQSYVINRCGGIEEGDGENKTPFIPFGFERFLNSDAILNSSDELISRDKFTIFLDVSVTEDFKLNSVHAINIFRAMSCEDNIIEILESDGSVKYKLPFNTPLFYYLQTESPYFKHIAETPMLEAANECMLISSDEYLAFTQLGRFVSTGTLRHIENVDDFIQLHKIADKYALLRIKEACGEHLQKYISHENVIDILILSDLHFDRNLKDKAIQYIQSTGFHISSNDSLQLINLNPELAKEISQVLPDINISSTETKREIQKIDTKEIKEDTDSDSNEIEYAKFNYFS